MAARKVILYFDDQTAALRFALAAGSVMSGENRAQLNAELVQEMQRASRVKLGDSFNPASTQSGSSASVAIEASSPS
ncbi:MAG TPA: hypothetical protein VF011_19375 [Terriglobales bacterium]